MTVSMLVLTLEAVETTLLVTTVVCGGSACVKTVWVEVVEVVPVEVLGSGVDVAVIV